VVRRLEGSGSCGESSPVRTWQASSNGPQAGDYLNVGLVFSGIIAIAIMGLGLDACLRGLLYLADPSKRQ